MLFFDLEFYVPKTDRQADRGSLIFNPTLMNHKILGGYFKIIDEITGEQIEEKSIWIWNHQNNESKILERIYSLFEAQWIRSEQLNIKSTGYKITDLLVVGFAISRADLPALYIKSSHYKIAPPVDLYNIFMKTKTIDLANVSAFLFPEDMILYPKSAKLVAERLNFPQEEKENGKMVWDWFDIGDFQRIENRCTSEVDSMIKLYQNLKKKINQLPNV